MAVSLSVARSVASLPSDLRLIVIDHAYDEDVNHGMELQAACRLVDKFDNQSEFEPVFRGEWYQVSANLELVQACIVGKFVFVEW